MNCLKSSSQSALTKPQTILWYRFNPHFRRLNHNQVNALNQQNKTKSPNLQSPNSKKLESEVKENELSEVLGKLIDFTGPIPLSAFMRQCLTHPTLGYYTRKDPLGQHGDFTTSPEISQLFGEMLGIWYYHVWELQGKLNQVNFIEFGPGKGTLMNDVLRVFRELLEKRMNDSGGGGGGTSTKLNVVLIEASDVLKRVQHQVLTKGEGELNTDGVFWKSTLFGKAQGSITWCDTELDVFDIIDLAKDTNFVIAHEFFDALPVNVFKKTRKDEWREILVDQNEKTKEFFLTQTPKETPSSKIPLSNERYNLSPVNSVIEISPETFKYSQTIAKLISSNDTQSGAALIIDYGTEDSIPSNTLRGIKDHRFVNPFTNPGEVDLSIDVDFKSVELTALENPKVSSLGIVTQQSWLTQMGILFRLQLLLKISKDPKTRKLLETGVMRLLDQNEMGKVYKFLGLVPKGFKSDLGFKKL